nr:MAG TPA: hypothetical protein [Caudoviricetes sp.]
MITRFRCFSWQERWRNLCFVTLFWQFDIIKLKHILPFFLSFLFHTFVNGKLFPQVCILLTLTDSSILIL